MASEAYLVSSGKPRWLNIKESYERDEPLLREIELGIKLACYFVAKFL